MSRKRTVNRLKSAEMIEPCIQSPFFMYPEMKTPIKGKRKNFVAELCEKNRWKSGAGYDDLSPMRRTYKLHLIMPATGPHVYEYVESVTMPPLTLLTLASLTPPNYDIRILDEAIEPVRPGPCDLAAISLIYFTAARAYRLADWYRSRNIPVVMGGPHATLCPGEVAGHCDALAIGEADELWPAILRDFEQGRMSRVYRAESPPDLTRLPPLRYDLIDKTRYDIQNLVQTGRGCPVGCDFCAIPALSGRAARHKTVPQVIREIEDSMRLARGFWRRLVVFSDDNLVSDQRFARELFEALIPLRIWWASQCSIAIALNDALLDLAVKSGCRGLFIGFETPNQAALDGVHKAYSAARFGEAISKLRARGVFLLGSFLFGLDGDTRDSFRDTVEFSLKNRLDFVNYHIVSPAPGTPFFRKLESEGRLLHRRWEHYQENAVFRPSGMTADELQQGQIWAYREFFRAGNIIRRALAYWPSGFRMLLVFFESLRVRRKIFSGIRSKERFLARSPGDEIGP